MKFNFLFYALILCVISCNVVFGVSTPGQDRESDTCQDCFLGCESSGCKGGTNKDPDLKGMTITELQVLDQAQLDKIAGNKDALEDLTDINRVKLMSMEGGKALDPSKFPDDAKIQYMSEIAKAGALDGNIDVTDPQFREAINEAFELDLGIMSKNPQAASEFIKNQGIANVPPELMEQLTSARMLINQDGIATMKIYNPGINDIEVEVAQEGLGLTMDQCFPPGRMMYCKFTVKPTGDYALGIDDSGNMVDSGSEGEDLGSFDTKDAQGVESTSNGVTIDSGTVSYYYPEFTILANDFEFGDFWGGGSYAFEFIGSLTDAPLILTNTDNVRREDDIITADFIQSGHTLHSDHFSYNASFENADDAYFFEDGYAFQSVDDLVIVRTDQNNRSITYIITDADNIEFNGKNLTYNELFVEYINFSNNKDGRRPDFVCLTRHPGGAIPRLACANVAEMAHEDSSCDTFYGHKDRPTRNIGLACLIS